MSKPLGEQCCAVNYRTKFLNSVRRRKIRNFPFICHTGRSRYPRIAAEGMDPGSCQKDSKLLPACSYTRTILRQAGFSIVSAIFLLVVLSALAAFIVNISSGQHVSAAADLRGAQAYQAARAGVEWGAYQVLDPNSTAAVATPPACPAPTTFTPFAGFSTTVTCVLSTHTENGNNIGVYRFTSTSTAGTIGTIDYVSRVLQVTVAKCLDPSASAPFSCS